MGNSMTNRRQENKGMQHTCHTRLKNEMVENIFIRHKEEDENSCCRILMTKKRLVRKRKETDWDLLLPYSECLYECMYDMCSKLTCTVTV